MTLQDIERQLLGHIMLDYVLYINHKDQYDEVKFTGINAEIFKHLHGQCVAGKINTLKIAKQIAPHFLGKTGDAMKYLSDCKTMIQLDQPVDEQLNYIIDTQDNSFLLKLTETLYNMAKSGNSVQEIQQYAFEGFETVTNRLKSKYSTFLDNLSELNNRINTNRQTGKTSGFKTGILAFDNFSNGLQETDLIILAARPSMGKTALSVQIAKNLAIQGIPVAFFTYEMTALQLTGRIVGNEIGMSSKHLTMEPLSDKEIDQFNKGIQPIQDIPLYIISPKNNLLNTIESEITKLVFQLGVKVIFIDFLQRMDVKGHQNEETKAGLIAKSLKNIAVQNKLAVFALSQLSREVEKRGDKRPIMSDIRQSGQIEEAADIISFLYRDEYYNPNSELTGIAEWLIKKGRNIGLANLNIGFHAEHGKFFNLDTFDQKLNKFTSMPNPDF